jgi:hypothetical protein
VKRASDWVMVAALACGVASGCSLQSRFTVRNPSAMDGEGPVDGALPPDAPPADGQVDNDAGADSSLVCDRMSAMQNCDRDPTNGCETDTQSDLEHCGACANACPVPEGGFARCEAGACVPECPEGTMRMTVGATMRCARVVPRAIAPMHGAAVQSRRPLFRVEPVPMMATRVELCSDPSCTRSPVPLAVTESGTGATRTLTPTADIPLSFTSGTRVYWRVASPTGAFSAPRAFTLIAPDTPFTMAQFGAQNPARLAALSFGARPDFNGDGRADIAVMSAGAMPMSAAAVRVYGAQRSEQALSTAPYATLTPPVAMRPITYVANLGDVNGDGTSDLAVVQDRTIVHVYAGAPSGFRPPVTLTTPSTGGGSFGAVVIAAGDVNGDGFADFAVAAPQGGRAGSAAGRVFVYAGRAGSIPTSPTWTLDGGSSSDEMNRGLGSQLAGACDVNGDGLHDLVATAPGGAGGLARVFVFASNPDTMMAPNARALTAESVLMPNGMSPGRALACAGDLDLDGDHEIALSNGQLSGNVLVYSGSSTGLQSANPLEINSPFFSGQSAFGHEILSGEDTNSDGLADLVVSAPGTGGDPMFVPTAVVYRTQVPPAGLPFTVHFPTMGVAADELFFVSLAMRPPFGVTVLPTLLWADVAGSSTSSLNFNDGGDLVFAVPDTTMAAGAVVIRRHTAPNGLFQPSAMAETALTAPMGAAGFVSALAR